MMTIAYVIISILVIALCICAVFINRLVSIITDVEEKIELSLDVINECYTQLYQVTQIPVFSDEPVVRNVVLQIKRSRDSLLMIANTIGTFEKEDK